MLRAPALAVVLVLVAVACGATPASAAPAWLAAATVSDPNGFVEGIDVAVTPAGVVYAAWAGATFGETAQLRVSVHRPGAAWALLPSLSAGLPGLACSPRVGVDGSGTVSVVWRQLTVPVDPVLGCSGGGTSVVEGATLAPAAAAFSAPVALSDPGNVVLLDLAQDPAGGLLAGWARGSSDPLIEGALRPVGGPFARTAISDRKLLGVTQVTDLAVAVAPSGGGLAVWAEGDAGVGTSDPVWAERAPGGGWGFVSPVTTEVFITNAPTVDAAYDPATGGMAIAYAEASTNPTTTHPCSQPTGGSMVCARRALANGVWQGPEVIGTVPAGYGVEGLVLATGGAGPATAAWAEYLDNAHSFVHVASHAAGQGWGGAQTLPATPVTTGFHTAPAAAVGPGGAAVVAWDAFAASSRLASLRDAAGAWSAPAGIVFATGTAEAAAFDAAGNAVVALGGALAQVAVHDASGPDIALTLPAAVAGTPVALTAAVTDRFSALAGEPAWSFGDGTTGSGTAATHTYAAAGSYAVTVTQADALGNVGTASGTVTVAPPPPPPPPPPAPRITITKASFAVTWRESAARGTLNLSGSAEEASSVVATLRRGRAAVRVVRFAVPAGAFVRRLRMPATLLPARYELALTGTAGGRALQPATVRATLTAPPEGVVDRFRIAGTRNGPDALSLTNARQIWSTFHLVALPRAGLPLHVDIVGPGGRKLAQKDFRRQADLVTRVGSSTGAALQKGRWTFVLRAGKIVVERASVRLR